MTDVVLSVKNLRAQWGDNILFQSLNFELHRSEILMVLGDSGCGKSTLIRMLIGLDQPYSGEIYIKGDPFLHHTEWMTMGMTFQSGALLGSMSLLENLILPLQSHTDFDKEALQYLALEKLRLVGLKKFAHYFPSQVSGGMLKRAAIARALMLEPKILFLDEPSAGLDPITAANLDKLIVKLAKTLKLSFIIVTHELSSVFNIADRILLISSEQKAMVAIGKPTDIVEQTQNPWVKQFLTRNTMQHVG